MNFYKSSIIWLVIVSITFTFILSPIPVYASAITDILSQSSSNNISNSSVSTGSNIVDLLLGMLLGKFLGTSQSTKQGIFENKNSAVGVNKGTNKELIGFYAEWWATDTSSFNSFSKNTDTIKTIAPFWATLDENGMVNDRGGNDHASVLSFAHQNNVSVLLMVNNAKQEGQGNTPIHTILSTPALRTKAINNLEAYIKKYNLDGINIDFEMVDSSDKDNLSAFMKELSLRLKPQGYIISIDVFPKQNESNDVSIAYDYAQLANYADKIILMTYDNHGSWSDAGPIADINWVEKNLKYALQFIPKNKLFIGIAAYGYDWSSKGVESLEYAPIMKLSQQFNSPILWDESAKSPHFSYTGSDGISHQVWYENKESLQYKLDLVTKYDIAGAALWKLGEEDPGYWDVFKNYFSKKQ